MPCANPVRPVPAVPSNPCTSSGAGAQAPLVCNCPNAFRPDRNAEYLYYQTAAGAWPLPLDRAIACKEKAAREARQHTDWSELNRPYEKALKEFVAGALADTAFTRSVEGFVNWITRAGCVNSLGQTLLKLAAPDVPDLYQGKAYGISVWWIRTIRGRWTSICARS